MGSWPAGTSERKDVGWRWCRYCTSGRHPARRPRHLGLDLRQVLELDREEVGHVARRDVLLAVVREHESSEERAGSVDRQDVLSGTSPPRLSLLELSLP